MFFCNHLRAIQSVLAALLFCSLPVSGQTDSLVMSLDSTKVTGRKTTASLTGRISDNVTWKLAVPGGAPKLLGTADPMRFVNMLPGVQTASEFDGGIHILGTDASHNEISIGGVPIYGSNHLFGLFSVFIPSHFNAMEYSPDSNGSDRLGGCVNMVLPDLTPGEAGGELSLGPLFSSLSIKTPTGGKSALYASARRSFINSFYHRRMTLRDGKISYGFYDCDLTWLYKPDKSNTILVDGYLGSDSASMSEELLRATISGKWGNSMASVHWNHSGASASMEHCAYFSHYGCDAAFDHELMTLRVPSSISTCGYRFKLVSGGLMTGFDAKYHDVTPQYSSRSESAGPCRQQALELVPSISFGGSIGLSTSYAAGLRALCYISPEREFLFLPEPYGELRRMTRSGGELSLKCSLKHQNLCRTGFTQTALPIEFYYLAGGISDTQSAATARISYDRSLWNGLLALSASAYCALLGNQVEYTGIIYDMLDPAYDNAAFIRSGAGRNAGLFVMVSKKSGKFTGWAGYAFSRSMRLFDGPEGMERFPSSHDRTHEFNLVCDYKAGDFDFGADFVAATGTPFTPPDFFYICSGKVLTHYSPHNSGRLEPYVRMDLSADWMLIDRDSRQLSLNFSVYNVLCRKNAMYHSLHVSEDGYCYGKNTFLDIGLMPSLSINLKF